MDTTNSFKENTVPLLHPFKMEESVSTIDNSHTNTTELKPKTTNSSSEPKTTTETITEAITIPTLENAPVKSQLKSHLVILVLVTSGILAAYIYGFELLQAEHASWAEMGITLTLLVMVGGGVFWGIGAHQVDWWEVVLGYWWVTTPAAVGGMMMLVRAMEGTEELAMKD